jgi:hypothetical protein
MTKREPRQTRTKTQDLFLAAQGVMNALALECLNDPAVPRDVAEKLNDDQQWLTGCDWAILGWDTADPPADAADQIRRIEPVDAAVTALFNRDDGPTTTDNASVKSLGHFPEFTFWGRSDGSLLCRRSDGASCLVRLNDDVWESANATGEPNWTASPVAEASLSREGAAYAHFYYFPPGTLRWDSAEHDDEPGDQTASSDVIDHGFWSLGPTDDRRWSVELIECDEDMNELPGAGRHLGEFDTESAAKAAAQEYEAERSAPTATCKHCGRTVTLVGGEWVDPNATGDDAMWRETCDSHETVDSEHEPIPDYIWPEPNGDGWIDAWNGWYDTLEHALEEAAGGGSRPWVLNRGEGLVDEDERERRDSVRKGLIADDTEGMADTEFEALEVECSACGVAYTGYGHKCDTNDPKDAALHEWRRRAEQAERALDEVEARNEDALRKLLADWFDAELFRISERGHSGEWPALIEDAKARHDTFGIPWSNTFVPEYVRDIMALDTDD